MPSHPVRVIANGGRPVRVVTHGPAEPVRIVTSYPSDPVRVVTRGVSDPVRVIGGGLAPDAPLFVSAEVGNIDASTLVAIFDANITASGGNYALGFTVFVNGVADAIMATVAAGSTISFTLTTAVIYGDTVTIAYSSATGDIYESTGVTPLATFAAQAVTNNVSSLLSGLVAFWPMNEANGNALEVVNSYAFSDIHAPLSDTGLVYPTARLLDGANDSFSRVNTVALRMGDIDFTFAGWFYVTAWPTAVPTDYHYILYNGSTWNGGVNLAVNQAHQLFVQFFAFNNLYRTIHYSTGIGSLNQWYLAGCKWNAALSLGYITFNNLAWDSDTEVSTRTGNTANPHVIGGSFEGRLGPCAFWNRILTDAEWTSFYNGGLGIAYPF